VDSRAHNHGHLWVGGGLSRVGRAGIAQRDVGARGVGVGPGDPGGARDGHPDGDHGGAADRNPGEVATAWLFLIFGLGPSLVGIMILTHGSQRPLVDERRTARQAEVPTLLSLYHPFSPRWSQRAMIHFGRG